MTITLEEIQKIVDRAFRGRTEFGKLEFKDARGGIPRGLWKPISAFSNTTGGVIIFGVKEVGRSRKCIVVENTDLPTLQEKIVSLIQQKMINIGAYDLKLFDYQDKQLLALSIEETPKEQKPCYQESIGLPRGVCIRVGNVNRQITDLELRAFLRYSPEYKYDKRSAENTTFEMLSTSKILNFLQKSADRKGRKFSNPKVDEKLLKNIGIIGDDNRPTIAGFLIFAKNEPQELQVFSRFIIRCVKYSGISPSSSITDQFDASGTLDEQLEDTFKFIVRNISTRVEIVGAKRLERTEYPRDAIREIVANALIHRDYMITGTYTNVSIFSDRIEVSNPGNLPPGITVENLKESQFSRNEITAKIMRDLDFMEEFGRGIDLIYAKMKEWNLAEPLFKNRANMFKVTLLGQRYSKLNNRQIEIWHYLQDNLSITASIAHDLFKGISRATINNDLKSMLKLGLVEMKGASSNTSYEAKY